MTDKIPKILIGVTTCHRFLHRADQQRRTWVKDAEQLGMDVRFFVGDGSDDPDVCQLPVPDDYNHLPLKVQGMFAYGVQHGYDFILKTDDDTIINSGNLLDVIQSIRPDYLGHSNGKYCSGFAYVLSNRIASRVAEANWDGDWAEDRWVGSVVKTAPTDNRFFIISRRQLGLRCRTHWRGSAIGWMECDECKTIGKKFIALCAYNYPEEVERLYMNLNR